MKKDKIKIYILEFVLLVVLCLALFVSNIFSKWILALILSLYAIIVVLLVKKKKVISYRKKDITILMAIFGIIYILIFYLLGLYFGYYKAPTKFNWYGIRMFIMPFTLIIISSEYIRKTFAHQKGKLSKILIFIAMVMIDLIVYTGVYNLSNIDDFLATIGFILFASIACNLLYNYITIRYGSKGVIIYRLITVLYAYIIPIIPDVYIFFRSFLRMVYPFLIYIIIDYTYARSNLVTAYKDKRKNTIRNSIILVIAAFVAMLVSCQFRYGILVIGSGSMTGSINKGDAVVYEKYLGQNITNGQVIIFNKNNTKYVHRVVDIKNFNGENRYFTKGDANQRNDDGYITDKDIIGVSDFKIVYIGWPTIWFRDMFK